MKNKTTIAEAGNTMAPALAVLRSLGYRVTRDSIGERRYRAEDECRMFVADDPLALLGLVKLYETKGDAWRPTDAQVLDLIALESEPAPAEPTQ
jgi:hypothetical protein